MVSQANEKQYSTDKESWYLIFRWDRNFGSPEKDATAAKDPKTLQSWGTVIAKAGESVEHWEQELWEVEELLLCTRRNPPRGSGVVEGAEI
jgi:hypothetical protein